MLEVPYKYRGRVVHVVDGDTLDILVDVGFNISHKIRIRLANVDTPEIYRPSCEAELEHGREASKFVKEHCYGKEVVLETGLKVRAPLFINVGDSIKVDTRTGEYLSRG